MTGTLSVFHVASCARSGETVLLRTLAAHSRVFVPVNIDKKEDESRARLAAGLMDRREQAIPRTDPLLEGIDTAGKGVLLLKQGTWEHRHPFKGFILARNPVSVYASLKNYDTAPATSARSRIRAFLGLRTTEGSRETSHDRMVRWSADIDPVLRELIRGCSFDEAFCAFYTRRMLPLARLGLPVIHYERFVTDPEGTVRAICAVLGIEYEDAMLNAHAAYSPRTEGHGKIDLAKPIGTESLTKYMETVGPDAYARIAALTYPAMQAFGYVPEYGSSHLPA